MKWTLGTLLLFAIACHAEPIRAQELDAQVLRPGEVRLSATALWTHVDSRFGDGTRSAAGELEVELDPIGFAPLGAGAATFAAFLAETADLPGSTPVDPFSLTAGSFGIDAALSTRVLPIRLAAGVLPRVELGVALPIQRFQRLIRRIELADGNVGINPDPIANAAVLQSFSPAGALFASSPLLPLAGSDVGMELQRRVEALAGTTLSLPESAVSGIALIQQFNTLPTLGYTSQWHPGDVEIDVRARLLGSFGDAPYPETGAGGSHHRVTLFGNLRLPTGTRPLPDFGLVPLTIAGFGSLGGGVVGDLFLGERFWLSGGGSFETFESNDVEYFLAGPDGPFAIGAEVATVTAAPGDRLAVWALPRVRLTPAIALGGSYRFDRGSDDVVALDDFEVQVAEGSAHKAGFSLRYSTLAVGAGGGFEVLAGYSAALAGSDGAQAPSEAYFQVNVRRRFLR